MTPEEAYSLIEADTILRGQRTTLWADLGCGSGTFTLALSRMLQPGSTIYAIDKSPGVRSHTTPNGVEIKTQKNDFVSDMLNLPPLDGILMANALHYVRDKGSFLQKLCSMLAPENPAPGLPGQIADNTSIPGSPLPVSSSSQLPSGLILIVEYDTDIPVPRWVPYPLSFKSLTSLFKTAGYHDIHQLGLHPSVYGSGNMYAAILSKK